MARRWVAGLLALNALTTPSHASPYDPDLVDYNLNTNLDPWAGIMDFTANWSAKSSAGYHPSPANWRSLPTYTILLDKFFDGDPQNNDFYDIKWEWDLSANQLRHGGDIMGFVNDRVLDYIYGMGYRVIFIAGTPWVNMPWQADGYSALDFTLLDPHYGTLADWRTAIDKIHSKGMYVMLDMTTTTMGDLIGVTKHLNESAPFSIDGYEVEYKWPPYASWGITEYRDFNISNTWNATCEFPPFYDSDGLAITDTGRTTGCYGSDYDQFGDVEAFGVHPDWSRQLAKFASVQDRLREWDPVVRAKLEHLACMTINALDPDAFRIDKATQQTVDFVGLWGQAVHACAKSVGKDNFFIPGEVTGGNTFGALYIGRGRQPVNYENLGFLDAFKVTANDSSRFMRGPGVNGLDAVAFHYSVYRSLTRFLSMDGNLAVAYDVDINWVTAWNVIFTTNDFLNWNTGQVDPRHMYGTSNQDVFRWPSLQNGTQKLALGQLITNLVMPGIPLGYYGEEQNFYLFDSTADNYLFGRQAMTATKAWQTHGCYRLGSQQYFDMPLEKALTGCNDDWNSLDHFDPTADMKLLLSHFMYLRTQYPALQDGFDLTQLGNWTTYGQLPGSNQTQTEWGMWSVTRSAIANQTLTGNNANVTVWMLFSNLNETRTFAYDCSSSDWISAPYPAPVTVRNLVYPYENYTLDASLSPYYLDGKAPYRGCLSSVTMDALGFKVLVPQANWVAPLPRLAGFAPGHDARLWSDGNIADVQLTLQYTDVMACTSITSAISLTSVLAPGVSAPSIDSSSVSCTPITPATTLNVTAAPRAVWQWTGTLKSAPDGIYQLKVTNATTTAGTSTASTDYLLFRKGTFDNPIVFQNTTYSTSLLSGSSASSLTLNNVATGAEKYRYSIDFGQTWTNWTDYVTSLTFPSDTFSANQNWTGQHIRVQYYSALSGSAAYAVDGDYGWSGNGGVRRYPFFDLRGPYNSWGFDAGVTSKMSIHDSGNFTLDIMVPWPNYFQAVPFGIKDNFYFGDVDGDLALDLLPPNTQAANYMNLSKPAGSYTGWRIMIDQRTMQWGATPIGSTALSLILFCLLGGIPPVTAFLACFLFLRAYYGIKVNKYGFKEKKGFALVPFLDSRKKNVFPEKVNEKTGEMGLAAGLGAAMGLHLKKPTGRRWPDDMAARRTVVIATLEYEVFDWKIKVKIGGLGVMSSLIGKSMSDIDLIWVVPKVKDIEYPEADHQPPITITVFGEPYHIELQTHKVDNVTYYFLDSPVFRANTKSDPYPARMDDLSSAIFYSTWNQCIAEIIVRNPQTDIYHINDYHGTLAPFYLLPAVLPVCLSLHNAEFQGLWPLRTKEETDEVCRAFNLDRDICEKYIQFGNVFNLLHAAASFISIHQKSVGVAGVSDKYGKRSWARYPALWTLKTIDSLPNPDPTDIEALDEQPRNMKQVTIDEKAEAQRPIDKQKSQEWAGLEQRADAELFVFVGRWSLQKGVDLIADVFPSVLEKNPKVQLIAIGPQVDLFGRFAAVKLNRLMELYPGRVFSKPEFTALPPFIFSGGDFALIPSRDEPFGLVAVEFGRKGALGVGSRLGGLGLMPGWWFPVESDSTVHMHSQFQKTIKAALKSTQHERAILRARSALQRFPVLEWRNRMEDMHRRSIKASRKYAGQMAWAGAIPGAVGHTLDLSTAELHSPPPDTPSGPRIGFGHDGGEFQPLYHDEPHSDSHLAPPSRPGMGHRDSGISDVSSVYSEADPRARTLAASGQPSYSSLDERSPYGPDSPSTPFHADGPYDSHNPYDHTPYDSQLSLDHPAEDGQPGSLLRRANTQLNRKLTRKLTRAHGRHALKDPFMATGQAEQVNTVYEEDELLPPHAAFASPSKRDSFDSINSLMKDHDASPLNKAMEDFTDQNGEVTQSFIAKLQSLSASNSTDEMCIADYLEKAEKDFFKHVRDEKLANAKSALESGSSRHSMIGSLRHDGNNDFGSVRHNHSVSHSAVDVVGSSLDDDESMSNVPLNQPTTLNAWQVRLQQNLGGWPLYALLLAVGQVLCATSFQLSLLGGSSSQGNTDLYIISGVNIPASVFWYLLNHTKPANYALALPWMFFGVSFILIGVPALSDSLKPYHIRHIITLVAECSYSWASAAGFLFFSSNFGEEAGGGINVWVFRACVVQGTQSVWAAALWYWGFKLTGVNPEATSSVMPVWINGITLTLGAMSFFISYLLFVGLPPYYRQLPGQVPNFVKTLFRRKIVLWYLASQVLQNYWLSGPYGRNWQFLWNRAGSTIPTWATVIMVVVFFIGLWTIIMIVLSRLSKEHTWMMPLVGIGLIAPRWAQMEWAVSGLGMYVPWAGVAGPYVASCLWLFLGVLDSIQGVGLGMILLQTLSRVHVAATLCLANIIGSTTVIAARATAPSRTGAGRVFPNFSLSYDGLGWWEFWLGLGCQVAIAIGFLVLFRKEQLSKP